MKQSIESIDLFFDVELQAILSPNDMAELAFILEEKDDYVAEEILFDSSFYDSLFGYFIYEMPYGIAKARTGDPVRWILDRLKR